MIIVTGGAGFIGSAIVWRLNQLGNDNILIVDELGKDEKWKNLVNLKFHDFINKHEFLNLVKENKDFNANSIIHMGANSSTTEKDADHLLSNNYEYTRELAKYSLHNGVRFIYASSAATYGDGKLGFTDDDSNCLNLKPLNMYGYSKNLFDCYAYKNNMFDKIVGLKYFNVYGPNEYHKGDMRSVVHKAFEQVMKEGKVRLFTSLNPNYKDGEQMRDFIYVKDAVEMTLFFLENKIGGLFNIGSGKARTWNDLVSALFKAANKPVNIEYIPLPEHLASKYQYFTEANLNKLIQTGFKNKISNLEDGVFDYVTNYLIPGKYLGE